ncbi:hypothetical protein MSG28_004066 [Choristoneura fumiferana]|uniref:Uncharacterized protein n=1 Tax=Choristoneura fumiferana TaxID=7141 RepID=A0ACC0KHR4_CHOFU|nr:hypothetical protein MSG28_004066 [Choristoneura fumiferana]
MESVFVYAAARRQVGVRACGARAGAGRGGGGGDARAARRHTPSSCRTRTSCDAHMSGANGRHVPHEEPLERQRGCEMQQAGVHEERRPRPVELVRPSPPHEWKHAADVVKAGHLKSPITNFKN